VTIDAVVAGSGVAATTIHRHFTNRRELVVALLTHLMPLPADAVDG
jgi:AcrR family transcriptional regulator